jgi:hypothetical protein
MNLKSIVNIFYCSELLDSNLYLIRRVWRYQSGNQNPYIKKEQTINTMAKRKITKGQTTIYKTYPYKTKDQVTRTPLKIRGELRCSGRVSSFCSTSGIHQLFHPSYGPMPFRTEGWPWELGDNFIVFENFTASIGHLMIINWVYWRRVSGASKRIFATIKSTIDAMKFQIQYSYLHSNVIMCRIDIHTSYIYISVLLTRWHKR